MTLAHGPLPSWDAAQTTALGSLAAVAALYVFAVVRSRASRRIAAWPRAASFLGGLVVLGVALSPAAEAAAARRLSAHMIQHLALWLVAPPLLVWGRPVTAGMLALPLAPRRGLHRLEVRVRPAMRVLAHPVVVWCVSAAALWGWHLPRAYQAAVRDAGVHASEHLAFLTAALLLWGAVLGSMPYRRPGRGAAIVLLFATMVQSAWLAMVLGLTERVVYPVYAIGAVDALADQQLAGVLMWVPMAVVYSVVTGLLALRWFGELDRRSRPNEASEQVPATVAGDR